MYIEYFPIPENESQTVILSFIGDRDLLGCCGQSSGSGSTRAAGESANVQHICKVNESIMIITSSEVTKSLFLYYPYFYNCKCMYYDNQTAMCRSVNHRVVIISNYLEMIVKIICTYFEFITTTTPAILTIQ